MVKLMMYTIKMGCLMKYKYLLHILMFFYFAAFSVMFPYLSIYFSQTLLPYQIGILMAIIPASMLFLQPFWGWAADKWGIRRILLITLSFTMIFTIGFLFVKTFIGFFIVLTIYSVFVSSIASLIDTMVLSLRNDKYGSIRLWGSIGYGIGVFFTGLFKSYLLGFWSFIIHMCLILITITFVLRIPNAAVKLNSKIGKFNFIERFSFFKNRNFIVLLVSLFLIGFVCKGFDIFFPVGLNNLKASGLLMGTTWIIEIIPEIFLFYFLDRIIGKISPWQILITGSIMFAVRMAILGLFPDLWVWIVSQPVSSIAYCFWYFGAIKIVKEMVAENQKSTGQAVFGSVTYGAGGMAGSFFSGYIVNGFGISTFFQVAALLCTISAIILILLYRHIRIKAIIKELGVS